MSDNNLKPLEFHFVPIPMDKKGLDILHGIDKQFMNRLQMSIGVPLDIYSSMSTLDLINTLRDTMQEKDNER